MSTYTIPSVVEKTLHGERAVDIYSRLLSDRIVYIGTEIDDGVANVVIAQMLHLESESPDSPINLYLNSPGGSVTAMLAIYDTMQFVRSHGGHDLRRTGGLVGGGPPRERRARPAHRAAARPGGPPPALRRRAGHAARPGPAGQGDRPAAGLDGGDPRRHTGQDVARLREDTDRDLILSAPDAVAYGIADAVLDSRKNGITQRDTPGR